MQFARHVDRTSPYMTNAEFSEAWRSACATGRRQILAAGFTAYRDVLRYDSNSQVSHLPEVNTGEVVSI